MSKKLKVHEGIYVKQSDIHGWGVFTDVEIEKGTTIEECVIPYELIPIDSRDLKEYRYVWPSRKHITNYCVVLGFGCVYNHSEENPNINWEINVKERIMTFTSIRKIVANEELLFNYQYPYKLNTNTNG